MQRKCSSFLSVRSKVLRLCSSKKRDVNLLRAEDFWTMEQWDIKRSFTFQHTCQYRWICCFFVWCSALGWGSHSSWRARERYLIRFMYSHLPSNLLLWSTRNDQCSVLFNRIMLELNPLSTMSSSGRNYVVHSTDVKNLNDYISDLCGRNYVVHSMLNLAIFFCSKSSEFYQK